MGGVPGEGGAVKALVELVARSLVERPEAVAVRVVDGPQETVIEVQVAAEDVGKVIGRGGRMAKSIRNILDAVGMKQRKRYTLEILE